MSDDQPADQPEIVTPTYVGSDRRMFRRKDGPIFTPRRLALLFVLAWLAIMGPLGAVLYYARNADGRAERAGRTVCTLAGAVEHLAETLDAGIGFVIADDDEARTAAERDLAVLAESARTIEADAREDCVLVED